jgi:hypothetical protein
MCLSFLSLIVNSLLAARFCLSSHTLILTMREERDGEILTGARGDGEEEAAFPPSLVLSVSACRFTLIPKSPLLLIAVPTV